MDQSKIEILELIRKDWVGRIEALFSRTAEAESSPAEMEKLRSDAQSLFTWLKYWISSRRKSGELEPEWSKMMQGFVEALTEFKTTIVLKTESMKKKSADNIDELIKMVQSNVYNSDKFTTSAMLLNISTLNEFKMMLADGRAVSSFPDPMTLLDGLKESINTIIKRRQEAREALPPTFLWGLTKDQIEKILETIIETDKESARLFFSRKRPKDKIRMIKPFLIFAVGRLIAEKKIQVKTVEAVDILHNHFIKKDGTSYSKVSIKRYFEDADLVKMGPLKSVFFGD